MKQRIVFRVYRFAGRAAGGALPNGHRRIYKGPTIEKPTLFPRLSGADHSRQRAAPSQEMIGFIYKRGANIIEKASAA